MAIKWWLGVYTSGGSLCSLCPDTVLDPLGHHASTCKRGGDDVFRHNRLHDIVGMVLAEALKSIILHNNIEAWTRFLMIPKCVLPSLKRGGKKRRPIPIEQLCQDWLDGKEALLWSSTVSRDKAAFGHADSDCAA